MTEASDLQRYLDAQERVYARALTEIKGGKKQSHWMWFIFPQLKGLGFSEIAQRYGIANKQEAAAYLQHPLLSARLIEISSALLKVKSNDAHAIFGSPDDLKLCSSMTLFSLLPNTNPVFQQVLDRFFGGKKDPQTLKLLERTT